MKYENNKCPLCGGEELLFANGSLGGEYASCQNFKCKNIFPIKADYLTPDAEDAVGSEKWLDWCEKHYGKRPKITVITKEDDDYYAATNND